AGGGAGGGGGAHAGGAQRCATGGQCLPERFGQLNGITVTLVVHVHHVRRHFVQVIVDGGDVETAGEQTRHHRRHFLIQQHQIAHDHRVVADLLERRIRSEREPGLDRNALDGYREIGARDAHAVYAASLYLACLAERLLNRLPVGVRSARDFRHRRGHKHTQHHHALCYLASHDDGSLFTVRTVDIAARRCPSGCSPYTRR